MEDIKACLPDLIQTRIDDLVNAQTMDEEMVAHMQDMDCRISDLAALVREGTEEQASQLAGDIQRLCDRIRSDYVAIAYRQGVVDGVRLNRIVAEDDEKTAASTGGRAEG
ncbi:MAG: hypothetical protein AB9872_02215 [Solidesulfovibrio sp.]